MREELLKVVEEMELRFKSGNHVPLSRASITAGEWKIVRESIAKAAQEEAVGEVVATDYGQPYGSLYDKPLAYGTKLYASPPSAQDSAELERGFALLAIYGVPRDRANSIANGIDVLATRYRKEIAALHMTISRQEDRAQVLVEAGDGCTLMVTGLTIDEAKRMIDREFGSVVWSRENGPLRTYPAREIIATISEKAGQNGQE